ncbi:peroxin 14/17 [Histoplasma capsulatum G186AR]|uniref:Peroxisomal membrane protein PEX14 n=2 Tax=Ajellomyces capsulatus TaxID=5037 RepID=C0NCW6_AJECG|nr:peroxin 14/17 [Histoplasma capsulatum G186AR]EEH11507.1 peroxin 14/17 [Histoplasma capsulatum G186AR]
MGENLKLKAPAIPSWQLSHSDNNTSNSATAVNAPKVELEKTDSPARETLIEQASVFLEDESIRDAPADKKIAFLESKGLENADIQKLLRVPRSPEATNAGTKSPSISTDSVKHIPSSAQLAHVDTSSATSPSPPSNNPSPPTTPTPPIITYPEFLLHTQKPPPLVTLQGVMYTLYGAGGLAATLYGASQFLINPMLAELSRARHELAETTQRNLSTLNEKLENTVSSIPPPPIHQHSSRHEQDLIDDDSASIISDPTELFHRDIATQTSPELSPNPTLPIDGLNAADLLSSEKTVDTHVKRLQSISSQLADYLSEEDNSGITHSSTEKSLGELKNYLDGLIYNNPSPYLGSNLYRLYNDNSGSISGNFSDVSEEADAIAAFKAEIRSVKGTLLSARNFPAGGGIRAPVPNTGAR